MIRGLRDSAKFTALSFYVAMNKKLIRSSRTLYFPQGLPIQDCEYRPKSFLSFRSVNTDLRVIWRSEY